MRVASPPSIPPFQRAERLISIKIQKDGEEPIYESDGISASNEFDVEIDESGTYTVEVTGKKAKGSVSFTVVTNQ